MAAAILRLFQQQIVGPMEAGSIQLIAYTACWPVAGAMFVEFVVLGTVKTSSKQSALVA